MGTLSFDALTEVVVIRDLLRRWWGLELGLAAGDGSGYVRVSHATCTSVRGATGNACAAMMREIAAGFAKAKAPGAVVRDCHAGMLVVAAPVFGASGLTGVVYASGAAGAPIADRLVTSIKCS